MPKWKKVVTTGRVDETSSGFLLTVELDLFSPIAIALAGLFFTFVGSSLSASAERCPN